MHSQIYNDNIEWVILNLADDKKNIHVSLETVVNIIDNMKGTDLYESVTDVC